MNLLYSLCLRKLYLVLTVFLLSGFTHGVHSSTIVLVAPTDIDSPAIKAIFQGIATRDKQSTLLAVESVNKTISERVPLGDSIIVLGRSLIEQIASAEMTSRIIGGAFYGAANNPAGIPTLSLEPSLETVVSEIRKTGFELARLRTVVATPATIFTDEAYTQDAAELDVVLSPTIVAGEQNFARAWFALLQDIDSSDEAIVITDDKYLESSGAYRHIMEAAWKKNILVVSTLPHYSRRGVSIGYIPDLSLYGQRLYDRLTDSSADQLTTGSHALWADATLLNRVFNLRTLVHISFRLPSDLDRLNGIDLVIE